MIVYEPIDTNGVNKRMKSMKGQTNEVALLEYQIQRYKRLRNGVMCQQLKQKLLKLKTA